MQKWYATTITYKGKKWCAFSHHTWNKTLKEKCEGKGQLGSNRIEIALQKKQQPKQNGRLVASKSKITHRIGKWTWKK
jgi:hypothetical protein